MRKFISLLLIALFLIACSKDDDQYEENELDSTLILGNWKKIQIPVSSCNDYLEFNVKTYREITVCSGSNTYTFQINYTIDGKDIVVNNFTLYKIIYISPTLLKLENNSNLIEEYVKLY